MEYYTNKRKPKLTPGTQKRYEKNYLTFSNYFKNKKIKDIDNYDYQKFINWYSKGHAKGTVEKIHSQVRAAFKFARANGYIDIDPTFDIDLKYEVKAKPEEELYINEHEFIALIKSITEGITHDDINRHLILLACATGARFGELVALTFDDYNFFTQQITINKSYDYVTTMDFKEPKTESSIRKVTIDNKTNEILQKYVEYQKGDLRNVNHLLFPSPDLLIQPISHNAVLKELRRHCRKVGIQEIGVHALRHTHASLMLLKGLTVEYISERLGHSSIETTRKYYLHIVEEMKKKSDKKVLNVFNEMYS